MPIEAGKLRHRVMIEQFVDMVNSAGERDPHWVPIAQVWASVEPMSAREFVASAQMQSQVTTRITIRYRAGITAGMRVAHRGKLYNIAGVLADKDSGIEYLTLPCSDGVNAW